MISRNEDNCKTITCIKCNEIMSQIEVMQTVIILKCDKCGSEHIYFVYDKLLIMGAKKEW